jgi:hypothetical protein
MAKNKCGKCTWPLSHCQGLQQVGDRRSYAESVCHALPWDWSRVIVSAAEVAVEDTFTRSAAGAFRSGEFASGTTSSAPCTWQMISGRAFMQAASGYPQSPLGRDGALWPLCCRS